MNDMIYAAEMMKRTKENDVAVVLITNQWPVVCVARPTPPRYVLFFTTILNSIMTWHNLDVDSVGYDDPSQECR
jgi:hypothetical protein